jgi:chromosomal replication initiator protein
MATVNKKSAWNDCLESIKVSVSPAIFTTWFSQTHLISLKKVNGRYTAEIGCPSLFVKTTIEARYFGLIQDSLTKSLGKKCDVVFSVKSPPDSEKPIDNTSAPLFVKTVEKDKDLLYKIKSARIRSRFTFKNYAVSSSNQMAWAASDAVAKNPGSAYNPLFIWGGVGVGKTHLMNAVGYEVVKKSDDKKVFFCTGEEFTNDIVEGIRKRTTQAFRNKYRKLDALLIDDIQFIAGKDAVQEEFFHTFNALVSSGSQILLTSDKPPSEISKLEERLKSRFEAGMIVDISPPDFELRCAIIQIKAKEKNLKLDMDLVQLIAGNIDSARRIEGFLTKLFSEAHLKETKNITEDMVKNAIGKGTDINGLDKKITAQEVLIAACKHFSVGKRAILGKSRTQTIALPRQIVMYFLRTQLKLPLQEVGRLIGGRDHTTVMHAVDKITNLTSKDVQIREDIQGIKNLL